MKRPLVLMLALLSNVAAAVPLSDLGTFCGTFPDQCRKGTQSLLAARGTGTNAYYVMEVDPTTGALPVAITGGSFSVSVASDGPTGSPVPAQANYIGLNNGGTLIGAIGDSSGRQVVVGAGTAGTPAGGVVSVQGVVSGTAVPISAASLPLPTGAATSAKQPAIGTAGASSTDVLSVQGISGGTALPVSGTFWQATQPVSGTVTANQGSPPWTVTGTGAAAAPAAGAVTVTPIDKVFSSQNITTRDLVSSTATGANNQGIITGTPTAGSAASFAFSSQATIKVQVTGTWTGTLQSEISIDSGTTWVLANINQDGVPYSVSSFTGNIIGSIPGSGVTNFRVRSILAQTGTATVTVNTTPNTSVVYTSNSTRISDGTTQSRIATVTPAVTAPSTSDPALVVSLSPNSPAITSSTGRAYADSVRYAYSSGAVGTSSWVQLIASTAATFNCLNLFDSSGQTLELGTGAAASETRKLIIPPGGLDGCVPLAIPSGTRISIRALSATTGALGEIDITGFN